MSSRKVSVIADDWNVPESAHIEVLDIISGELDLRYGYDLGTLYEEFGGDFPEGVEPEIEEGEYMDVLNSMDERTWHERTVDVLTHKYETILETSDYDMMIRDLDLNHSSDNYRASKAPVSSRKDLADLSLPITDVDFAMIAFDQGKILVGFWDVKTRGKDHSSSDLDEKIDSVAKEVSSEEIIIDPELNKITSQHVGLELDKMGVETLPNHYIGDYRLSEDFDPVNYRKEFQLFVESFMGYESLEEIEEISEKRS